MLAVLRSRVVQRGLLLAASAGACAALAPSSPSPPAGKPSAVNLLLLTLDTTRADHLGCYGDRSAATPRLDAIASGGALVEAAEAVAPLTLPAHASILTGLYPIRHGVRDNSDYRLPDVETTLAEHLRAHGYATGAIVASAVLSAAQGLSQGFGTYDEPHAAKGPVSPGAALVYEPDVERPASEVTRRALEVLDRFPPGPFFLWVHYYDPHMDYAPPPPYRERFAGRPYDGEIAFMDSEIGRLLDGVARKRPRGSTLVAVIGDHGEALGDHGERTHGLLLYEATVRVPLLLRLPGVVAPGTRVTGVVSEVDLVPTLLDLLRLPAMRGVQGQSFANAVLGRAMPKGREPAFSETIYGERAYGWAPIFAAHDGDRKFVEAPEPELYDLRKDPGENHNLATERPEAAAALASRLAAWRARSGSPDPSSEAPASEERRRMLESLGYVSGGPGAPRRHGPRLDPKRGIALNDLFFEARAQVTAGHLDAARALLDRLLEADPGNPLALSSSGSVLVSLGDAKEGLRRMEAAASAAPGVFEIQRNLAARLRDAGRLDDAARSYRSAIAIRPSSSDAHYGLGKVLYAQRESGEAISEYEEALRLGLDTPSLHAALGLARIATGSAEEASAELGRAEGSDPRVLSEAYRQLGWLWAHRGRAADSRAAYENALRIDPKDPETLLGHARACLGMGDREAAEGSLERLLAVRPDHPSARFALAEVRLERGDRAGAAAALREFLGQAGADPGLLPKAREMLSRIDGG